MQSKAVVVVSFLLLFCILGTGCGNSLKPETVDRMISFLTPSSTPAGSPDAKLPSVPATELKTWRIYKNKGNDFEVRYPRDLGVGTGGGADRGIIPLGTAEMIESSDLNEAKVELYKYPKPSGDGACELLFLGQAEPVNDLAKNLPSMVVKQDRKFTLHEFVVSEIRYDTHVLNYTALDGTVCYSAALFIRYRNAETLNQLSQRTKVPLNQIKHFDANQFVPTFSKIFSTFKFVK